MSRNVSIMTCRGYQYVRVCESYRNAEGKPRSKVVENHGRLETLLARDPEYVEKLRARVRQENDAARIARHAQLESSAQERIRKLEKAATGGDYGCARPLNIGAALLRWIWKEDLGLPQAFRHLQGRTDVEYSYDQAAFLLASQRIINPCSKKKTFENRHSSILPCGVEDVNVVYRVLDRLSADKPYLIRHINRRISARLKRTVSAAFYDVTTYAFESRTADEQKNFGLSKDHKVNEVQVVLGLVMDEDGIPIDYDLFPGNTSEFGTMMPIIRRIRKDYELKTLVVVADRGLNSNENLSALREAGCDFVIAQKIKSCAAWQRELILSDAGWEQCMDKDGEVICRYKTLDMKKPLFKTESSPGNGGRARPGQPAGEMDVRWIVSHSRSRAVKDLSDLDRAVEKAEKAIRSRRSLTPSRGYKGLISMPKGEGAPSLDLKKIEAARMWAGYYAVCTSLQAKTPGDIMKIYRKLWQIEDCFRVSKTTLEARPCFVWTEDRIRGHFMACFISLVIEKYMRHVLKQRIPDITHDEINDAIRTASVALDDGNPQAPVYLRLYPNTSRFDAMLHAFGLEPPRRYESPLDLRRKLRLRQIYKGDAAS